MNNNPGHESASPEVVFALDTVGIADISDTRINPATEETVSQLVMTITNAIDSPAYDLNAAAFSEVTSITNDYQLSNILLNFSTAEAKTITITGPDGTILWGGSVDTSASNLGYNTTKKHFNLDFNDIGFNASENITVAVTQFSSAGIMDCIVKIKQGSNTLAGDPVVQGEDQILGGNQPLPVDRSGRYIPIIAEEHSRIHEALGFTCTGKATVANGANFDILIKNPADNFPHFRFYAISSENAPADIFLYEATTVSADGSACNVYNNNRNSANTSNPSLFTGPTVTGVGTEIEYSLIAGSKQIGGSAESITVEWNLKPNENYMVRYTNNSGQNSTIGFHLFFYDTSI